MPGQPDGGVCGGSHCNIDNPRALGQRVDEYAVQVAVTRGTTPQPNGEEASIVPIGVEIDGTLLPIQRVGHRDGVGLHQVKSGDIGGVGHHTNIKGVILGCRIPASPEAQHGATYRLIELRKHYIAVVCGRRHHVHTIDTVAIAVGVGGIGIALGGSDIGAFVPTGVNHTIAASGRGILEIVTVRQREQSTRSVQVNHRGGTCIVISAKCPYRDSVVGTGL